MAGWAAIKQIRDLEERANMLGMTLAPYRHSALDDQYVSLVPWHQQSLPVYTRDAVLFAGSLDDADHFMQGVLWAREYDRMVIDRNLDTRRVRKEQDERNRRLLKTLKDGGVPKKENP